MSTDYADYTDVCNKEPFYKRHNQETFQEIFVPLC
jgi:hypothetical protein